MRTPLATILGYVETLMNPKAGGDEATRDQFLETIRHEAMRMQALVSDLMSLSRIEANKHEVPGDIARSWSRWQGDGGRILGTAARCR